MAAADASIAIAIRFLDQATGPMKRSMGQMQAHTAMTESALSSLMTTAKAAGFALAGFATAAGVLGTKFNEQVESSGVGIAALLSSQGKFVDAQGKELAGREKINAALGLSSDLVKQLQVDNLKTTATFEQLLNAFQVTLAPGLAKGLNVDQVRQYTVAMVQAASAMQVPLDQMAEETRSLLEGTITPRNTRIATALGITPADVKQWEGNADGWFKWVMGKLEAFKQFGGIQATTYGGLMSNIKDITSNVLGQATKPFFDELKAALKGAYDYAVKVDEVTGDIKLNPELLNAMQILNDALRAGLALAQGLATALVAVGTAYSATKSAAVSVGASNAGFAGSEADDLTNYQRLTRVKEIMAEISTNQDDIANANQAISRGDPFARLYQTFQELNLALKQSSLENFREQMVKAGQDTTQVDAVLKNLKTTMEESFRNSDILTEGMSNNMESLEDSFKRSDTLTDALYSSMERVAYSVDKASLSAEEFKKRLQEIANINLDNVTRDLDKKLIELDAKLSAANQGLKGAQQSTAAQIAVQRQELKQAFENAVKEGAPLDAIAQIKSSEGKLDKIEFKEAALFAKNEANKEARKKGGAGPVNIEKVDQDILKFKERMGKMYQELHGLDMDYEATRLEASGQFYAAEEVRVNKKVSDQKAAFAKEVQDAEQAYLELQQKLGGKKGATAEAQAAVAALKGEWVEAKQRAEQYGQTVARNAQQELELFKKRQTLQGNIDLAQTNVTYAELAGTMEQQLRAQMALIQASREEKLANVNKDIPGLAEAYKKLYDEQERVAKLNATGSFSEGMADEARKIGRSIPTAAMQGREAMQMLKRGIDDAAGALADFAMTGKMDFGSMAQSIIRDMIKMQIQATLTSAVFGSSGGAGGLFGFIGGLFGMGGGSASAASSSAGFALNPTVFPFASGGDFGAGKTLLVGEKGPEIVKFNKPGTVIPNNQLPIQSSSQRPIAVSVKIDNQTGQKFEVDQGMTRTDAENVQTSIVLRRVQTNSAYRSQMRNALGVG